MASRASKPLNSEIVTTSSASGNSASRTRRFGVFEVDLRAGELRRNGMKIKLQEQPFRVLALLLEKSGEIVSREELRNRLWAADTFVDFDHSLNAAIKRLRDALGDTAENPRFVDTVARRGYRFVAPVENPANGTAATTDGAGTNVATANVATTGGPTANGTRENVNPLAEDSFASGQLVALSGKKFKFWWIAIGVGAIVLVLVGLRLGLLLGKHTDALPRVTRLTANPADDGVRAAAISPDGRYLAFSDCTGLYLREIDDGETHVVTTPQTSPLTSGAGTLGWFPDSAHLIVGRMGSGADAGLWEISVLGGTPRQITNDGWSPEVSPDGARIAYIRGQKMHEEIWLVAADGAQPSKIAGDDGDFFGSLAWSPDGARLAYARGRYVYAWGVKAVIDVRDLTRQAVETVVSSSALNGAMAWTSDNRLIYTLAEPPPRGDSNLWSVALDHEGKIAGTPARLTNDTGLIASVNVSTNGKRLAVLRGVQEPDVYVAKIEHGGLSEPRRLTLDDRQDFPYDWTTDGKSVIFISDRTGTFSIYRQDIDRAVPEVLVSGPGTTTLPRLSPDGSQLLYLVYPSVPETSLTIPLMRMPLAGGAPQEVFAAKSISNHQCARLPATVCVYSEIDTGALTFYSFDAMSSDPAARNPAPAGRRIFQVKDEFPSLYNWSLSPDGSGLAIVKGKWGNEAPKIRMFSLATKTESWVEIEGTPGISSLDWAADSKSFWAASAEQDGNALLNIDLHGRVRTAWRPKNMTIGWAIPSRNGRYLALRVGSGSSNVWMLENF
jgi:Tol biopolymer transport system component/DNA-binding winged helix-turn-helix (wHTH) protein